MRPLVTNLSSYIRDTAHLLQNLEGLSVPLDSILVTVDIEALYSSIPHTKGIEVIKHFISQSHRDDKPLHRFILSALDFILLHNAFAFDGSHFLQIQSVAMGTCCAPSYANLYLGELENYFLSDDRSSVFTEKLLVWYRYIDNIFLIWNWSVDTLNQCIASMGRTDFNLKFTIACDHHKITFLDVTILKNPAGHLSSVLYHKETAGNTILHAISFHLAPLIKSIPYTQYLCIRLNCSEESSFQIEVNKLQTRLLQRGYSSTGLKKVYRGAKEKTDIWCSLTPLKRDKIEIKKIHR